MTSELLFLQRKREILLQTMANGHLYVENCAPWDIPPAWPRPDCPMRQLALYEPAPTDFFTVCRPLGVIAEVLLTLQAINPRAQGDSPSTQPDGSAPKLNQEEQ